MPLPIDECRFGRMLACRSWKGMGIGVDIGERFPLGDWEFVIPGSSVVDRMPCFALMLYSAGAILWEELCPAGLPCLDTNDADEGVCRDSTYGCGFEHPHPV